MRTFQVKTLALLFFSIFWLSPVEAQTWPRRVLITNDSTIDEPRLHALADAFATVSETVVVVPTAAAGISDASLEGRREGRTLEVRKGFSGRHLTVFMVEGSPADCIDIALGGIMREAPPDLVIAGIGERPGLGEDWLWSPVVGAARLAAYWGFPAISIAGIPSDDADTMAAVTDWIVDLSQSSLPQRLEPGQYLTVTVPDVPATEIGGIRISRRSPVLRPPLYRKVWTDTPESRDVWLREKAPQAAGESSGTDVAAYRLHFIVVVPMRVDEHDYPLMEWLREAPEELPPWPSDWNP